MRRLPFPRRPRANPPTKQVLASERAATRTFPFSVCGNWLNRRHARSNLGSILNVGSHPRLSRYAIALSVRSSAVG